MSEERRDSTRVAILGHLPGEVMTSQRMTVRDISVDGATIETAFPLHLDSLHDLRLTLGDRPVVLKGRVVNSCVTEVDQETVVYRSGLEFVERSERVIAALAHYVARLEIERRGTEIT